MTALHLLVSYPKSGNTWMRVFLSSLQNGGGGVDINRLTIPNVADRTLIDQKLGISSAEMSIEEMLLSRRCLFDFYAQEKKKDVTFLKVHDSFSPSENGMGIFLDEAITSIIYIVRDPRDVALSFAGHLGVSVDKIIDIMAQKNFSLAACRT